jgi:hypothetical protein
MARPQVVPVRGTAKPRKANNNEKTRQLGALPLHCLLCINKTWRFSDKANAALTQNYVYKKTRYTCSVGLSSCNTMFIVPGTIPFLNTE